MAGGKNSLHLFDDLLFPKIFQTFRISIQPSKLIITFSALAVICLAGWVMDFGKTVVARSDGTTELDVYMGDPGGLKQFIARNKDFTDWHTGVFSTLWHFAAERFHGAVESVFSLDIAGVVGNIVGYLSAVGWALRYHPVYCIIFFVIKLAVISVAGGAVCRITALQFARDEKPGLTEALRFSTKRFTSFFTAPLAPIGIIIFVGLFILLLGLIGNIPRAGELIIGICMLLALIAGALIAVIAIGAVAGFNLMFPAVAYDGSDCFDAISRSFSYVYAKPWRMLFYTVIAAIYGSICYIFVRFFAFLLLCATRWFLELGIWVDSSSKEVDKLTAIWPKPQFMNLLGPSSSVATNWSESTGAFLVYVSLLVVVGLLVSFIISFYFSVNTIIYSLMRNKVDNTALEDVYTHFEETEIETSPAEPEPQEAPPQPSSESQSDSPPSQQ